MYVVEPGKLPSKKTTKWRSITLSSSLSLADIQIGLSRPPTITSYVPRNGCWRRGECRWIQTSAVQLENALERTASRASQLGGASISPE